MKGSASNSIPDASTPDAATGSPQTNPSTISTGFATPFGSFGVQVGPKGTRVETSAGEFEIKIPQ